MMLNRFVAKIQDLNIPIARNQNLIIKSIMAHRKQVVGIACISEDTDAKVAHRRHDLLQSTGVCAAFSSD